MHLPLTDSDLLRHYIAGQSEIAIGELVRRHVGAVYSIALPGPGKHASS
jgi:hypothetical protein